MKAKSAKGTMPKVKQHWMAGLVLLAYLGLATTYSLVTPIWEAYDEDEHYQYARYIATKEMLPQAGDQAIETNLEKIQPPLYYLLAAAVMRTLNVSEYVEPVLNPYMPSGNAGVNYAVHSDAEAMPYRGITLAVHIVRLLSVLIGAVAVFFTYLIGLNIVKQREIAVGAMFLHAFWPQFLFNSSTVTNDVLAAAMGSIATYCMVKIILKGPSLWRVIALGIVMGLALLSKLNTIVLIPIAALVLIKAAYDRLRGTAHRKRLGLLGIVAFSCLAVLMAWWAIGEMPYVRLPWPFNSASSFSEFIQISQKQLTNGSVHIAGQALLYMAKTFYASFGWGNVEIAQPYYYAAWVLQTIAIVGGVFALHKRQEMLPGLPLLVCSVIMFSLAIEVLVLALYHRNAFAAPGRYLLPGISAYMVFLAAGFATLGKALVKGLQQRFRATTSATWQLLHEIALGTSGAIVFFIALFIPFCFIQPAYAKPSPISEETIKYPLKVSFFNQLELIGYEVKPQVLQAGEGLDVVLYWRCLTKMKENYTVSVQVLDAEHGYAGGVDSYPGGGNYATSLWNPGEIVQDAYHFRIRADFPPQSFAQLRVKVSRDDTMSQFLINDMYGEPDDTEVVFGQIRVSTPNSETPEPATRDGTIFGDYFALFGYDLPAVVQPGETETIVFYWRSLAPTDTNYTVFVHLVDAEGNVIAQADSQPRQARFPTALWAKGDTIQDAHTISVPPTAASGEYTLRVGFYRLETMERLPARNEAGQLLSDNQLIIKGLTIR
ncbi:MAG: glycosyltransferase family 39 protein [Chloroflexi bacterium]|nr:glycosyltransferase family 39 protein [Chloroflexota bacterium]